MADTDWIDLLSDAEKAAGKTRPSLLDDITQYGLSGLGRVANLLDVPASVGRDLVTWLPGGLEPQNPFDQLVPGNWTNAESRVGSWRDIFRSYGLASEEDTWTNFLTGVGADILTDPLTYLTMGSAAWSQGGKAARAAGLADDMLEVAARKGGVQLGTIGERQARSMLKVSDLVEHGGRKAEGSLRKYARANKLKYEDLLPQPLGGAFGFNLPSKNPRLLVGPGETGQKIAKFLDDYSLYPFNAGRKVKDFTIPGTKIRPVGDLEILVNSRIANAQRAITRVAAGSLWDQKLKNYSEVMDFTGQFAQTLRRNDFISKEAGEKLRGALESTLDTVPEDIPAEVMDMVRLAKTEMIPMVDEANFYGLKQSDLVDDLVSIGEGDYFPRFLNTKIDEIGGARFNDPAVYSTSDRSAFGRKAPLKGVRGMTNTINDMAADNVLNDLIAKGASTEELAEHLRTAYPDVMQNSEFPSYDEVLNYRAAKAAGEEDLINPGIDQYEAFAKWVQRIPDEIRKEGVFGNHPLFDMSERMINHKDRITATKTIFKVLAEPGVIGENIEGGVRVSDFFQQAKLKTGRAKQVLRDMMQKNGIDPGPMQKGKSGRTPLTAKLIDPQIAEDLLVHLKGIDIPEPGNRLVQAWDSLRNLWKGTQTGPWPGFHVRNFMSGQIDNMIAGTFSPKSVKMAYQLFMGQVVKGAKDLEDVKSAARRAGYQVDDIVFEPGGMRDRFVDYFDELFADDAVPHNITREQVDDIVRLAEARAGMWSIETGLPADEYFAQFKGIATADATAFRAGLNKSDSVLFQDHPYAIPLKELNSGQLYGVTRSGETVDIMPRQDGRFQVDIGYSQGMEATTLGTFDTLADAKRAAFEELADFNAPSPIAGEQMFYSRAKRATLQKVSGPVNYQQFAATMKKVGVDEEELADLMMPEFFAGGKKAPEEIVQHINRNSPAFDFQKVDPAVQEDYADIALQNPPGTDYGVMLMKLRNTSDDITFTRSDHGFGDDTIAFAQFDTVPTASGGKALRVQGIQSDWHAEGAKSGYYSPDVLPKQVGVTWQQIDEAAAKGEKITAYKAGESAKSSVVVVGRDGFDAITDTGERFRIDRLMNAPKNYAPEAPFKNSWAMLMMKRMVRKAVEEGYDELHIASGSHIAEAVNGPAEQLSKFYDSYLTNKMRKYTKKWKSYEGTQGGVYVQFPEIITDQPVSDHVSQTLRRRATILAEESDVPRRLSDLEQASYSDRTIAATRSELEEQLLHAQVRLEEAQGSAASALAGMDPDLQGALQDAVSYRTQMVLQRQRDLDELDALVDGGLRVEGKPAIDPLGPAPANVFKITDKMRESVMDGQPLYQQYLGQAKGATLFDDYRATIVAFAGADVSTLVHEIGHVFRKDLPPALQKQARDAIGQLVDTVTNSDGTWTREAEEEFARGFERWMRDGKAPTKELAGVFKRFRNWLTKIYKHLTGSAVETAVSPELKQVFDKMLGADAPVRGVLDDKAATDILGQLLFANRIGGRYEGVAEAVIGQSNERTGRGSYDDIMRQMPQTDFQQFNAGETFKRLLGRTDETTLNPVTAEWRGVGGAEESTFGPMAAGHDVGHATEFLNRAAPFIEQLRQGVEPTFAAAKVGATQVMYQNKYFTKFEQQVMQRAMPFYKFCVPVSHEIMTRRGWLKYDQLKPTDEALTLNHDTGELQWQRVQAVNVFDHDGDLLVHSHKKNSRSVAWWFTDEHRWPVVKRQKTMSYERLDGTTTTTTYGGQRVFRTGAELTESDMVPSTGEYCAQTTCLSPRHAALLGWIVTDGYIRQRGNRYEAVLYQTPHKHLNEIAQLTGNTPRKPHPETGCCAVNVSAADLAVITEHYRGLSDLCSVVSQLSREAAEAMWDAMMKADGSTHTDGRPKALANHYDKTPEVSDAFQMLCFMTGRSCHVSHTQCCVRHSKGHNIGANLTRQHYSGKVWCPTTKNGTWIMRHNGAAIITGNSRGKLPWVFDRLWDHPAGGLGRALRVIGDLQAQAEFTPDYVAETASIPLNGLLPPEDPTVDRYLTGFGASFEDPISFLQGPRGAMLEGLSRIDPFVKGSLEWATGESFFQKGPMGGRDLIDQDPTIGRTISNVSDWWTGEQSRRPVELPDWLEHAAMNSPVSRLLTSTRQLTDQRKDAITKLLNLGTGIRVTDISEGARDAVIDERLGELKRDLGAKAFTRTYFRKEDKAEMSEEELAKVAEMERLSNMLAERAKARKARRMEENGEEPPEKKRKKKASWRKARGLE
jgi:hypothetical protein